MDSSQEIIHHFFHEHPLRQVSNLDAATDFRRYNWCFGCWRFFLPGEAAYGCCNENCGFECCLHEECAEMPREIRHPLHPSHLLTQQDLTATLLGRNIESSRCAACEGPIHGLGYICSEDGCNLWIHLGCAGGLDLDKERENKGMKLHPSHPQHALSFVMRPSSFKCDACGTTEKGSSYVCTICDYWIHETCAALPTTADFPRHHPDHSLSLAFHPLCEYIQYEYECAVCSGALRLRRWVYHCELCRYVVHIKCATNTSPAIASTEINNEHAVDDHKDIIKSPINDIYEEIIRPFVERESREIFIPHDEDKKIINGKYKFHNHHHPLSFITFSSASSHDHNEEDDDDDGDIENIPRLALTCDGCTMHIHKKSSTSCSYDNGYMSCGECNYFLHLACFNLPPELPSLPLHPIKDHKLALRKSDKLIHWPFCSVCYKYTNGLFYACTTCSFNLDIKCASLSDTIKHAGHPQHHHYLKLVADNHGSSFCGACYDYISEELAFYSCDSCKFSICWKCVLLPASNKHRLEKHRLPLTYDACINHPSEFYCGSCEEKVNPKTWMYHCQDCDQSFHPECFPSTSGKYRNINFGRQQYYVNVTTIYHHPHHPLRFQIITTKTRCDLCHRDAYGRPGFQCASCNFVMCLSHMDSFKPIDEQKTTFD